MLRRRAGSAKGPSPSGRAIARMAASQPASRRFASWLAVNQSTPRAFTGIEKMAVARRGAARAADLQIYMDHH